MRKTPEEKLAEFQGDEEVAREYSHYTGCPGDTGYHCSCYEEGGMFGKECCICGKDGSIEPVEVST